MEPEKETQANQIMTILTTYRESVKKIQEALTVVGLPAPLVEAYTTNLPDFDKMMPGDVVSFFSDIRSMVILYLDQQGFSLREIARRIGCGHSTVDMVIKKYKEQMDRLNKVADEAVEKSHLPIPQTQNEST